QQLLCTCQRFGFQFRCGTVPRLAFLKSLRTLLPLHFHVSLDSDHRYAERLDDFFRLHTSGHDHLTGEHAETPHVRFLMLKHRQVTVHITHLSLFGFNGDPTVNLRHTGRKDWQLHLWHAFSYQPLATYATIFRLILISSTTRKSPPRSGGLTFVPPTVSRVRRRETAQPVRRKQFPFDGIDYC